MEIDTMKKMAATEHTKLTMSERQRFLCVCRLLHPAHAKTTQQEMPTQVKG